MTASLPVTIRPVRTDDFEAWLPLWAGYNQFYGRFGPTALAGRHHGHDLVALF
jgi:hypothetical protein